MKRGLTVALSVVAACGTAAPGEDGREIAKTAVSAAVEREVARVTEGTDRLVAIAYRDLADGTEVLVEADELVHAASTMKIAVMIETFRRVDLGTLQLDARLRVHNEFASIVDGSSYSLSAEDDSDPELYERIGDYATLRELNLRMIRRSSNLATNLLVELLRASKIQKAIESLGTGRTQVLRGVEDSKAYRAGLSNTTTARDLCVLMSAIARGEAASADACMAMREVLVGQEFDDAIPAGLPEGTVVAHKTGRITGIRHDAAIVYPEQGTPYVLVVLTRGFEDSDEAAAAIAGVARAVHRARAE